MSIEVAAQPAPGQDELLDREALALVADLEHRFGDRRRALLQARDEREARFAAGERPGFPAETRELREAEWSVAAAPPDLDDRRVELTGAGRSEDGHQRAQLRRERVHVLPRGRALADLGQRRRRPRRGARRDPAHARVRLARRQALLARRGARDDRRAPARLAPRGAPCARRRPARLGEPLRPRALPALERARGGRARQRALRVPREAREPPRGRALERRVRRGPGGRRPSARDDPRDRPDRDDHRGVRDGGDPLRAARALRRPQRRALGLHLQRDQEVPRRPGVRAARTAPP